MYEEAEIHRTAIMQDIRDSEKKKWKKMAERHLFWIFVVWNLSWVILV